MKRLSTICTALAACLLATNQGWAEPYGTLPTNRLAAYFDVQPVAEEAAAEEAAKDEAVNGVAEDEAEHSTDGDDSSACGCGGENGCCNGCGDDCGNGCGCCCSCTSNGDLCSGWSLCNCCPGDAWSLQKELQPCCDQTYKYAGWVQTGYHSEHTGFSVDDGDLLDTNDVPDDVRLQQLWFYTEKVAEADACSSDWGYRFDLVYGTDAQKTQAFGNPAGGVNAEGWDNDWDHGIYGWAAPQAYLQYAYGDWSWKVGHWYTPMGYEVFPATGNFFYSHSLQFFNSEPFTHTGAIGTYTPDECNTYYVGWALGWDTGFDQFGDGNIFVGGVSRKVNDDVTLGYMTCTGNLGFRSADEFGYTHTLLGILDLTDKTQYVIQSDLVAADGYLGDDTRDNFEVGIANYLFHTVNDCWKLGGRFEWWQSDAINDDSTAYFELTGGINYRPHANVVIRPEYRYDFTADDEVAPDFDKDIFAIDAIFTY
jgi:hypothetical protein